MGTYIHLLTLPKQLVVDEDAAGMCSEARWWWDGQVTRCRRGESEERRDPRRGGGGQAHGERGSGTNLQRDPGRRGDWERKDRLIDKRDVRQTRKEASKQSDGEKETGRGRVRMTGRGRHAG